jgi:hypothetical protein
MVRTVQDGAQVVSEYTAPAYQSQGIGSPTIAGNSCDKDAHSWGSGDNQAIFAMTGRKSSG